MNDSTFLEMSRGGEENADVSLNLQCITTLTSCCVGLHHVSTSDVTRRNAMHTSHSVSTFSACPHDHHGQERFA